MAEITFTIPDAKLPRIIAAIKGLYPIPVDDDGVPLFTDAQWGKEAVRWWLVKSVARWEQRQALDAVAYQEEDDIVT